MHNIRYLDNGLKVVMRNMSDCESVTVQFFVGAGGRYENMKTEYGTSHFLEHLLFKGTPKRPSAKQISEEVDSVGGLMNAYTGEDHTAYYIKLPKNYAPLALNILSDILTDPLLEQVEIDRERNVILEEMKVLEDDPARYVYDLVGDLLWPHDTLRTNVIGTEQIISSMERETISNYFKQLYTINNMIISVAGNINSDEIMSVTTELLSKIQTKNSRTWSKISGGINPRKMNFLQLDCNQAHMVVCGRGTHIDAEDEAAMKMLSTILGGGMSSRLFLNIREKLGLAYTIHMMTQNFIDSGKFEIYAGLNLEKVEEAASAIVDELKRIQEKTVEPIELAKAKEQLRGRLIMGLESNSAFADWQGTQLLLNGKVKTLNEVLEKISRVSEEDVKAAAQKYLSPELLRVAMIAPYNEDRAEKLTKLLER